MPHAQRIRMMLGSFIPIEDDDWEKLSANFKHRSFKKGELLIREGEHETYMNFLIKGATRNFFMHNDKEYTIEFFFEGEFVTAYYSLITNEPSLITIEFIENAEVISFPYRDIENLHKTSLENNIVGRKMAEMHYIKRLRREMELLSLTAEERYNKLLDKNPAMVSNISVKHLSSYLGIHPESLSRIRKKRLS